MNKLKLIEDKKTLTQMVDEFYESYVIGRKIAYPRVERAFAKIKNLDSEFPKIMEGLRKYKIYWEQQGTEKHHIPHPASWINDKRWKDEIEIEDTGDYNQWM